MKKNLLELSGKILPVSKNQFNDKFNLLEKRVKSIKQFSRKTNNTNSNKLNKLISNIEDTNNKIGNYDQILEKLNKLDEEIHKHIDFTYRDLMIVLEKKLNFIPKHQIKLETKNPIAFESNDHKVPHGTIRDNTRYPRFIRKCELLFSKKEHLYMLDLGCSGGGMVLDACLRGHTGIGLEGSDSSLIIQRAEWRLLQKNLFTCDITKPFNLTENNKPCKFDIITAWEVMEHLPEKSLEQFFKNLKKHMNKSSVFICSVSPWEDIDPITKINWHVNAKPKEWWIDRFKKAEFNILDNIFEEADYPRGKYNAPNFYEILNQQTTVENNFHFVIQKK